MVLSVNNPITTRDMRGVKDFYPGPRAFGSKAGKVFLLMGANGSEIVIKDDSVYEDQVAHSTAIMGAIHQASSHVAILSPQEKAALKEYCRLYFEIRREYKRMGMKYHSEMKQSVRNLQEALNAMDSNFQKQSVQNVKDIKGALETRLNGGDKSELVNFTNTLKAPGGLEGLGEIVTADLVIGNTDRFWPKGYGTGEEKVKAWTIGGQQFNFEVLVNPGNVFVSLGPGGRASGLDFLDPQSPFKNFNMGLEEHEQAYDTKWPARILRDRTARSKFASSIINDLELLLNPHKSKYSTRTKLGRARKGRLVRGMVSGAGKVATKLQQMYPVNMPGNVQERYDILRRVH